MFTWYNDCKAITIRTTLVRLDNVRHIRGAYKMYMYGKQKKGYSSTFWMLLAIAALCGLVLYIHHIDSEIAFYENVKTHTEAEEWPAQKPFVNTAANTAPYVSQTSLDAALSHYIAPEGFTIYSHSEHWDNEKLILLYEELKQNIHGKEIEKLCEIIIYPQESEELNALATYTTAAAAASFYVKFPAFPKDFSVELPVYTGRINIYGGDTRNTIESIAGSLSHEYGHHYTFYYMFDRDARVNHLLGEGEYARLRNAGQHGLLTALEFDQNYSSLRHKYIAEIAAEDYVQLMGSPTTRQVADYYDVKQLVENPELTNPHFIERNAFPQENMMIPLASEVPGLREYFYSFIDTPVRAPSEHRQDITLQITAQPVVRDLTTGVHTYLHYSISWNTPYENAVYTVACFDPYDYTGWGVPIKTVRPGDSASAVIGDYSAVRNRMVYSMDDGLAHGVKVFYVAARLPDGTYYMSEPLEFNFG